MYFHSVDDHRAKSGARVFCKKCQKETAFFRTKCLECGTAYVKQMSGTGKKLTFTNHLKGHIRQAKIRDERIAYYQRKAAESRAKWEGNASPKCPEVSAEVCQTDTATDPKVG